MRALHFLLFAFTTMVTSHQLNSAAVSPSSMLSRVEPPLDLDAIKLLTEAADSQVQTVLDNKVKSLRGSPRSLCREVRRLVTPYVWSDSNHHHDEALEEHISEMLETLRKRQHADGTFSVGNRHSPPDTGFLIEDFGIMYRILKADDGELSQEWADTIRGILRGAGRGLSKGGIHTPNHRWKVCAALARITNILHDDPDTDNRALVDRVNQWLAEGIDIDADGIYSERSPIYFSEVTNPSLLTIARELDRSELVMDVRHNLNVTIQLSTPEGEIESIQSRRQDQDQSPRFITSFYMQFRELAILDGNGQFAAMAHLIERQFGSQLGDYLGNFLERPELAVQLPPDQAPFLDSKKVYTAAKLVRERRGKLAASIFGGTDFYDKEGKPSDLFNTYGSGLSTNPTFFRAWNGEAVLEAVRLVPDFFSMGHFRSDGIQLDEHNTSVTLSQQLEIPYYLPMPPELRDQNGDYKLSQSVDGRFYSKLDFSNRPTDPRRLSTNVTVTTTEEGYELAFEVTGEEEVGMTLELTFRTGGTLEGVEEAVDEEENKVWQLKNGTGQYTLGKDKITFGPGNGDGAIMAAPGELYKWLKGSLKVEGEKVYITGVTPMSYTLKLGFP
ncbi:hypothetical protein LIA77_11721 [Sarocladium implicatum]|nr:hypothetical protein LIA77_11721 [Sarocladium implicatum]